LYSANGRISNIVEPLRAGEVIFYHHPLFVCGTSQSRRTTRILEVNTTLECPLILDNGDHLPIQQQVKRTMMLEDGKLVENPTAEFKYISEYMLEDSITDDYNEHRTTAVGRALKNCITIFNDEYVAYAKANDMPKDLIYNKDMSEEESDNESTALSSLSSNNESGTTTRKARGVSFSKVTNALTTVQEEDVEYEQEIASVSTGAINYHAVVLSGNAARQELEQVARTGQQKQAYDVNKSRSHTGGEVIGKWTVCTLSMPQDRNDFTPKNLPVVVCGQNHYKKSNTIRYR
jgi:hypothetical protein